MSDITKQNKDLTPKEIEAHTKISLSERFKLMKQSSNKALLIDISGSMRDLIPPSFEVSKYQIMQQILEKIPAQNKFCFDTHCERFTKLPKPRGNTALHKAFDYIKTQNLSEVILVTDGQPDSEALALESARDLKIDIIYIGPKPVPDFLINLAELTNGSFVDANQATLLLNGTIKEIENKIKGFLNA